jgi:hypothetical protein
LDIKDLSKLILIFHEIILAYKEYHNYTLSEIKTIIEEGIINDTLPQTLKAVVPHSTIQSLSILKQMSMELQRSKPSEWNELLDICIQ